MHGGKSVSGSASGTYKTGRYSKSIPERLAARYAEAQADERLTEMREEIALLDARLGELLSRLDTGESGAIWSALMKAKYQFHTAHPGEKQQRLDALLSLIDEGHNDRLNWAEIGETVEARRKLAESEHKRLKDLQQMMTTEQAMTLLGAVLTTIKDHVTDPDVLRALHTDLSGILQRAPAARA